jgi:hypothetical protein
MKDVINGDIKMWAKYRGPTHDENMCVAQLDSKYYIEQATNHFVSLAGSNETRLRLKRWHLTQVSLQISAHILGIQYLIQLWSQLQHKRSSPHFLVLCMCVYILGL